MPKALQTHHPITEQILQQVKGIDVQLPDTVEEKWLAIEHLEVSLALQVAELGYRYMDLREAVGEGNFKAELEKRGLSRSRIYRYIDIAQFFLTADEALVPTLGHLKPSQIDELTRLPAPKKQSLTPAEIEELGRLSVRNLRSVVRQICLEHSEEEKLAAENQVLKRRLEQAQLEAFEAIQEANKEALRKAPQTVYGYHPLVAHIKQVMPEATEHATQAAMLGRHFLSQLQSLPNNQQARLGAEALYFWVETAWRQLGHVLSQLKAQYPTPEIDNAPAPSYDPAEWQFAESRRQLVAEVHKKLLKKRGAK